ncbi:alpha-E domain-containing protein [Modicisalibacter radicis]|uniref:alpha-E domain-containing protein n=1 Tax=Halomonas sp. EAR18 TaxID=2518972 RepID=UPI00109C64B0|nr:alpha-E domain-containing protein [Halomonas sp. EAR18]
MLSRVAENLYWMARYIERAEDTARLVSVNSHLLLDLPHQTALGWSTLIDITGGDELFDKKYDRRSEKNVVHFLCVEPDNPGSILSSLAGARENLRTTRDVVSREIWELINELYLEVRDQAESGLTPRRRDAFLKRVIRGCQTLTGVIEGTLSHLSAKTFIELGRHLERADMTTRILDVRSGNLLPKDPEELRPFEHLQWMSVLKSLTGYQMYRQQVRLRVRGPDVLRFLLQNQHFPRAVARSLEALAWELQSLPRHDRALAAAALVRADVLEADMQALARSTDELHAFIDELQIGFNTLHEAIVTTYFARLEDTPRGLLHGGEATIAEEDDED